MRSRSSRSRWVSWSTLFACCLCTGRAQEPNLVARMKELDLSSLSGAVATYYSAPHRQHAEELQAAIADMKDYYHGRLGVETSVSLALLDAKDWKRVTGHDYSLPFAGGEPPVIIMPATSDNPVFSLIEARKEAIPPEQLQAYLGDHHTTFAAIAAVCGDLIGFHELGHHLSERFGIDLQNHWMSEFVATYWSYEYIFDRRPEWKGVFDLIARPSKVRPRNTSLEDFERLYTRVDDYGWYQGMFEQGVREMYPRLGSKFLRDLKEAFPRSPGQRASEEERVATRVKPAELIRRLDRIAPGFRKWAEEFNSERRTATGKQE